MNRVLTFSSTHILHHPRRIVKHFFVGRFFPGDFFPSEFFWRRFFSGVLKGGSHPRTHHSNFNHIPLNDIHIAIRFHTIPHTTTTTPHTHIHLHTHLHAHIHTYAYTHTGQPGNVDKKAYNHTQNKKQKVNAPKSACSRACTHAYA